MHQSSSKISRRSFLTLGSLTALSAAAANGLWLEPRRIEIEHLNLSLDKMPPGHQLRLVQLSDLHIRKFHYFYEKVAETVHELAPEIIVITGDFLEEGRNLEAVHKFIGMLRAPHGIFTVQGNWEYWARVEGENLRQAFKRWGAEMLINRRFDLEVKGVPLSILGLDYPSSSDALDALQRRANPTRLNLLLSHVPAFDHQLLDGRIDLMLAGHTHGGQVRIPLVAPLTLPRFSAPFVAGLYRVGPNTPLYVNRGIGTSALPVRFFCPPEITLIEINAVKP